MSFSIHQLLAKPTSDATLSPPMRHSPKLTASLSNISTAPSDNSLTAVTSPFELQNIPTESEFVILNTNRFNLSLKLLDKILYLRSDDSGTDLTPLRGYLCISVKKPVRISDIKLQFQGFLKIKYFSNNNRPDPQGQKYTSVPIFDQSRTWQYKPNDKVFDCDYFTKGLFTYPFQFLIPNNIPETMSNVFGSTDYSVAVTINPISSSIAKTLLSPTQFTESLPIQVVQCDTEREATSSTSSDALFIGNWRHLLLYKISISHRQVTIGDSLRFYIKLLPIIPYGYILQNIKIYLDQITEYHIEDRLTEAEKQLYHLHLSNTESILLENIHVDPTDDDIQCWEFDTKIKKVHPGCALNNNTKKKEVILVPTTNALENKICHFKVTHKVKVVLAVEEKFIDGKSINVDNSDVVKSFSMRNRSQSVDKSLYNTRAEKSDNAMIRSLAKLVQEKDNKKPKVDLVLTSDVEILKGESVDGNMPPPTYCATNLEGHSDSRFEEVSTKTFSVIDFRKQKQKQKPQLNFIVPPAYEEIEELLEPPPYLNNL